MENSMKIKKIAPNLAGFWTINLTALGAAALLALAAPAWAQTAPTITVPTDLTHEEDANAENRFTFVERRISTRTSTTLTATASPAWFSPALPTRACWLSAAAISPPTNSP